MVHRLTLVLLRPLEPEDLPGLYVQKNDPEIADALGGFCSGYSMLDLEEPLARRVART